MGSWTYFYITIAMYITIVIVSLILCTFFFEWCGLRMCRKCKEPRTQNNVNENPELITMNGLRERLDYERNVYFI